MIFFHFFPLCIYFTLLTSVSSFSFVLSLFPFTFSSFSLLLFHISPQMTSADSSCLEGGREVFSNIYTPVYKSLLPSSSLRVSSPHLSHIYFTFILYLFYIYFITLKIIVLLNALFIIIGWCMYASAPDSSVMITHLSLSLRYLHCSVFIIVVTTVPTVITYNVSS